MEEKLITKKSHGVNLFLILLVALTGTVLVFTLDRASVSNLNLFPIIIWTLVAVLSESSSVYYSNRICFVSPVEAVFCGCYLSSGPISTAICIMLTFLLNVTKDEDKYWHIFNTSRRYVIFNIFHHILIMLVLHQFSRLFELLPYKLEIIPAVVIAPLFFTLSCLINALLYKIEDGESFRASFNEIFNPYYQAAFPASFAAVIIAKAYPVYGVLSIVIMVIPLLITIISFRSQARGEN